jgi:hypothetical protein
MTKFYENQKLSVLSIILTNELIGSSVVIMLLKIISIKLKMKKKDETSTWNRLVYRMEFHRTMTFLKRWFLLGTIQS